MTKLHPRITAALDLSLKASVRELVPLVYTQPPDPHDDVPAYARAASAVRRLRQQLVIVQDDVNALAIYDYEADRLFPTMLPRGPGERRRFDDTFGNKHHKMDLEALALLPDERLVAFGSGASPAREQLAVVSGTAPPYVHDATSLYRSLRAEPAFAGSELNIEGAVVAGDRLLLFQRGNGAARGGREPINAIGTLDLERFVQWLDGQGAVPALLDVMHYDLGKIGGLPLGFTDAAVAADGRIAIIACAEDSADALTDGPVLGCRFGWLEPGGELRTSDVLEGGRPTRLKLEGIERVPASVGEFYVVADGDNPLEPGLLGRLRVQE